MKDFTSHKAKLETQLNTIVEELKGLGIYDEHSDNWEAVPDQEVSGADADENTNADASEAAEERQATMSDLEIEYHDIRRALKKIEAGTYGICEISGEPIEEKRLLIKPDARTCIAHMNEENQLPL